MRQLGIEPQWTQRWPVENRIKNNRRSISTKRHCPRGHLVQHRAEGEEVGAHIKLLSFGLLRRHVRHGPQRRARTGQLLGARSSRRLEPHARRLCDLTADRRQFGEPRSEEHTSELQSQFHLVCRLLLEKKKK